MNGDPVFTHAVDSGKMPYLKFLLNPPFCVDTLLNLPGLPRMELELGWTCPFMEAVTVVQKISVECAAAVGLLAAGARIMVPVKNFEDSTVSPTSMLHQIIYAQGYPADTRDTIHGSDNTGGLKLLASCYYPSGSP